MTDDKPGPKEIIHDERIVPLMTQIIEICQAANISIFANFELDDRVDENGEPYRRSCQTSIPQPGDEDRAAQFMSVARPSTRLFAFTIIGPSNHEPEPDGPDA